MIFDQNSTGDDDWLGLGFGWTAIATQARASRMICAGVSVEARIGGTVDGALRIGGTPELVEC